MFKMAKTRDGRECLAGTSLPIAPHLGMGIGRSCRYPAFFSGERGTTIAVLKACRALLSGLFCSLIAFFSVDFTPCPAYACHLCELVLRIQPGGSAAVD